MNQADELARRVAEAMFAREGVGPALGIAIEEVREGFARVSMRVRADMLSGHGIAHGGIVFTLAATAFGYAANSRNEATVAQQASIALLSQGREGEALFAEAREASRAGRSGVYHVKVSAGDGRAVAEFTALSRTLGRTVIDSH